MEFRSVCGAMDLFKIAQSVATPLSLAGFCAAGFFYILKLLIVKDIVRPLKGQANKVVVLRFVTFLFVLALVALVLGVIAYLVTH